MTVLSDKDTIQLNGVFQGAAASDVLVNGVPQSTNTRDDVYRNGTKI